MKFQNQFFLAFLLLVSLNENGIPLVNGLPVPLILPPPWKFMVPMVPAGSTELGATVGGASPAMSAPFLPYGGYPGYPGLWSPYFGGIPPLPFFMSNPFLTPPASNETDMALLTFLAAKAEEKKEKEKAKAKKVTKDTTAVIGDDDDETGLPDLSQLADVFKNLLLTTNLASNNSGEESSKEDDGAADSGVAVENFLKDFLQK